VLTATRRLYTAFWETGALLMLVIPVGAIFSLVVPFTDDVTTTQFFVQCMGLLLALVIAAPAFVILWRTPALPPLRESNALLQVLAPIGRLAAATIPLFLGAVVAAYVALALVDPAMKENETCASVTSKSTSDACDAATAANSHAFEGLLNSFFVPVVAIAIAIGIWVGLFALIVNIRRLDWAGHIRREVAHILRRPTRQRVTFWSIWVRAVSPIVLGIVAYRETVWAAYVAQHPSASVGPLL